MERDQASKFVNDLLRLMVGRNGSDLFLTSDFPPAIKVDGRINKVSPQPLTGQHTLQLARAVMNDKQAEDGVFGRYIPKTRRLIPVNEGAIFEGNRPSIQLQRIGPYNPGRAEIILHLKFKAVLRPLQTALHIQRLQQKLWNLRHNLPPEKTLVD
jgi:hypothetical protein